MAFRQSYWPGQILSECSVGKQHSDLLDGLALSGWAATHAMPERRAQAAGGTATRTRALGTVQSRTRVLPVPDSARGGPRRGMGYDRAKPKRHPLLFGY